jgi:hypothetical protein
MAVHRGEVRAHRHDRYVAPPSITPRRDIAGPLVVSARVLLNGLEAESFAIPSQFDKPGLVLSRLAPFASERAHRELFRSCGLHDVERNTSVMEEVTASAGG